jgi:hypothetical protein
MHEFGLPAARKGRREQETSRMTPCPSAFLAGVRFYAAMFS